MPRSGGAMNPKILVVDDDTASVETTIEVLEREGYQLFSASGGHQALEILREEDIDVVITDLKMPDLSGIDLLKYIQNYNLHTQVIILTGYGTIDSAVEAMREGAFYYLKKPIEINTLRQTVINALEKQLLLRQNIILREQLDDKFGFDNIIGRSKQMLELFRKIRLVAPTKATVLITGESGVGKELIAKAIHNHSPRRDSSYKPINCGALHRELLESELFGHERGAYWRDCDETGSIRTSRWRDAVS
jgi:DNA-binding NtrC family response regulator